MGFFGKSKEEKLRDAEAAAAAAAAQLLAAAQSGDVAACRAALDGGADKHCRGDVRACVRVRWLAARARCAAPRQAKRTRAAAACAR
jgi:hypothetical protein